MASGFLLRFSVTCTICLASYHPAKAQIVSSPQFGNIDQKTSLAILINAFQNCGPAQAYQLLGSQMFQIIAAQTGGMGCFASIQQLGPLQALDEISRIDYPAGPVYQFRSTHGFNSFYWVIGISRYTGKVEWLSSSPQPIPPPANISAVQAAPLPSDPQAPQQAKVVPVQKDQPGSKPPEDAAQGCIIYPAMCRRS